MLHAICEYIVCAVEGNEAIQALSGREDRQKNSKTKNSCNAPHHLGEKLDSKTARQTTAMTNRPQLVTK